MGILRPRVCSSPCSRFDRGYSRIVRNRKADRDTAATPLAERSDPRGLESLRQDLERLESGEVLGNSTRYGALLQKCGAAKALEEGIRLHRHISSSSFKGDTYVGNHLVQMYASCGCLQRACEVFQEIRYPNVFSWNILVAAYAQNGHLQRAFAAFRCTPEKDTISWSTMITAFTQHGRCRNALGLFREMDMEGATPNKVTFLSVLEACAALGALTDGKQIHTEVLNRPDLAHDEKIETAIINMYGKCGQLQEARSMLESMNNPSPVAANAVISAYAQHGHMQEAEVLFSALQTPTVSSWNIIIKAYAQTGHIAQAMKHFKLMDVSGFQPDTITLVSLFDACANIPAPTEGKMIHSSLCFDLDGPISTALLFMYGKFGNLDLARTLFDGLIEKSVVPWTAIIAAYAHNGHGDAALELFQRMIQEGGVPNEVTFNTILCACSHAGLMDHARGYFHAMHDFGIRANVEHYASVLDLLGRLGKLRDAEELAHSMPFEPGSIAWTTLLGACSTHGEVSAASRLFPMSSTDSSSSYVLLHNVFRCQKEA